MDRIECWQHNGSRLRAKAIRLPRKFSRTSEQFVPVPNQRLKIDNSPSSLLVRVGVQGQTLNDGCFLQTADADSQTATSSIQNLEVI